SCARARPTSRSATATTCRPRVARACARNMVPNLPAPITPTVTGRPAASRASSMLWRFTGAPPRRSGRGAARLVRPRLYCFTGWRRRPSLTGCLQHEVLDLAGPLRRWATRQPDPGRALLRRIDLQALAGTIAFGAAECIGSFRAIGRAIRRHRAADPAMRYFGTRPEHDSGRRLPGLLGRILGGVLGGIGGVLDLAIDLGLGIVEPAAKRFQNADR